MPPVLIERRTWHCLYCDEDFKSGDFFGCAGDKFRKHQVEPVTYHSTHDNHVICVTKEKLATNPQTGESQRVPGHQAMFVNGHYTTSDPEFQEKLDSIKATGGLVTLEAYTNSKLTDRQRADRAQGQLKEQGNLLSEKQAEIDRLRRELESKNGGSGDQQSEAPIPNSPGLPGQQRARRA